MTLQALVYTTTDLAAAKRSLSAVLGEPETDTDWYVGWTVDGIDVGVTTQGGGRPVVPSWKVDDIEAAVSDLVAAGATVEKAPAEVGGGRKVATLVDAGGTVIGVLQDS